MTHDAGITKQTFDVRLSVAGDLVEVEAVERGAEVLALAQDGQPRKPGLKPFQADLLEQAAIVVDGPAPLLVVVAPVEIVVAVPRAAEDAVCSLEEPRFGSSHCPVLNAISIVFTAPLPDS